MPSQTVYAGRMACQMRGRNPATVPAFPLFLLSSQSDLAEDGQSTCDRRTQSCGSRGLPLQYELPRGGESASLEATEVDPGCYRNTSHVRTIPP